MRIHCNINKYTEMYDVTTYCVPVCKTTMSCLANHRHADGGGNIHYPITDVLPLSGWKPTM